MIIFVGSNCHRGNVKISLEVNKTERQSLRKAEMIATQHPIASCCYFHNSDVVEKQCRENSKGIGCAFVIPFTHKKTCFQPCSLYSVLSTGCVSSANVFLILPLPLPPLFRLLLTDAEK